MDFLTKINWKVRFKNRIWVITFIAGILLLAQTILNLFGVNFDYTGLQADIIKIVNAVFGLLAIIGISVDGTTEGFGDSENALSYTVPGLNENDLEGEYEEQDK